MPKRTLRMRTGLVTVLGVVLLSVRVTPAQEGKALYESNCAPCHGASGNGDGPAARTLKPPPGTFATSAKAHSETEVVRVITQGTPHPTFAKKLAADQIAAIAQYVKHIAAK